MTQDNKETKQRKVELTLTQAAADKIKSMMQRDGKEQSCLRVGVMTGGCAGLSYDLRFQKKAYDNDYTMEQHGIRILMNEESVPYINGLTIDYVDTLNESGFKYINPNANSSCGCGVSFS